MATIEALTERVLLLETLSNRQSGQLQQMSEQMTIQMKSHQAVHEEVAKMSGRSPAGNHQIDKLLLPKPYEGEKEKWRMFSTKLISCLSKTHPNLKHAMTTEMGSSRPITQDKLDSYELSQEAQDCLAEQLTSLLVGEAWLSIENHMRSSSLERWRLLSCACDPKGGIHRACRYESHN